MKIITEHPGYTA